ncbi:uncharacterized protein LOC143022554 isoform X2 [Oratosquilla oratoria]|uniref:uncharacterized protein LOC143022554 isoform X2 n=1 Tax=Oratosquilla oratoria TaxID=337810 RepID=UPI003F75784E
MQNPLCHNGCPDQNLEGSNCSTPAIPDCSHIGTTAQFRDKESEDVRGIISSVPHEIIQSFHDEPNPQHPASGADSNGQHVPPFELHENLNDELNLEHPASEVNSNEQDVPPFEPQEILNGSSCSFPAKKKKQSAVIHRQRMQICRLLKKIEKIKKYNIMSVGTSITVCIMCSVSVTCTYYA